MPGIRMAATALPALALPAGPTAAQKKDHPGAGGSDRMNRDGSIAMAKRKSVNYPGYSHQNPIPNASRIGNIVMSSIMNGTEPGTRNVPPDLAGQVANIFKHIRLAIEAAGGTPDDIIKVNFWMKQPSTGRAALNDEWVKMFPDAASRPARHTLQLSADSAHHVTCDFTAVIGG